MKLELDPFLVDIINFEEKNVPVRTDQASTTRGKNVVVSDELKVRMMKPWNLRLTSGRRSRWTWKPTSSFSMEKYVRMRRERLWRGYRVGGLHAVPGMMHGTGRRASQQRH
jgi:hypothetical protein